MYTRLCYVHSYVLSSIFSLDRNTISCACHSNSSIHHSDNATTHRRRLFPLSALTVLFRTLSPYLCRSNAAAAAALALPVAVGVGIGIDSDFSLLCTVVHFMPLFFFGRTRNSVLVFCFFTFYSISFIFCEISNNNNTSKNS